MPKRRKRHTFKSTQVRRVHPNELPTKHHHTHEQINADEYELEPVSRADDRLSVSTVFTIRSESPPIEVIEVLPPNKHKFQRTAYYPEVSMTQPAFRSFIVSPSSHLLREVSLLPWRTVSVGDEIVRESILRKKNRWEPLKKIKPINVPLISLVVAVAIGLCLIIILAVLLSTKRKDDSFSSNSFVSSACGTNCMMSLTPSLAATIASWPFDGSLSDLNNIYSGTYTNPPTLNFTIGNVGQAISFYESQYVYSATQFMDLSYQSWTIEAWLLLNDLSVERGIFGQCESSTTTDRCLSLSIKNKRLSLNFNNDGVNGKTYLPISSVTWRHVAFVYDYTTMQQSIYLDGVLEATTGTSAVAAGPYKGASGQVTIGWTNGNNYFNGRIDLMKVSSGAKTACQILNDATLTAYYPFDISTSYLDSSYNAIHGTSNLLMSAAGRINQAYVFQYESSYFQSSAFTAYSGSEPFSISLWVKPFVVTSGTLIHIATGINGDSESCFDMLGFSSSGQLAAGLFNSWTAACCPYPNNATCPCKGTAGINGPTAIVNTWTHIVLTYSQSNGMALYTDGTLQGVTQSFGSFPYTPYDYGNTRPYMTVGNSRRNGSIPGCLGGNSISPASYQGVIDDLRVYSREITKTEICSLYYIS